MPIHQQLRIRRKAHFQKLRPLLAVSLLLFIGGSLSVSSCQTAHSAAPTPTRAPLTATIAPNPITLVPTSTPEKLGAADHIFGPDKAFLTIAVYSDFQCKQCVDVARSLIAIQDRYKDDVRIIWRHFPQKNNNNARLAAQASEAASDQDRFWPMHDLLFVKQAEWSNLPSDQFRAKLSEYAKLIGIPDMNTFNTTLDTHRYAQLIEVAYQEALALGFKGVPALLFNGIPYDSRIDEYALDDYTRLRLLEKRWFKKAPTLLVNLDHHFTATLVTEKGDVEIELLPKAAPVAVNNFIFLARQGWYDNITFHLVTPILVETGDPSGSGLGTAGYNIVDEFDSGMLLDREGLVAMVNSFDQGLQNSASSQFFITLAPWQPVEYTKHHSIFGRVTKGMDVLRKLRPRNPFDETHDPNPPPGDKLITVKILETP